MKIVIPMSGFGERFRRAGYTVPKPLIEVEGKPIIAHVIDMFPGEKDFIFICNQAHLDEQAYGMESILRNYCPSGKIVGISPHKLGPVHAVLQIEPHLFDPDEPVIVNYCDFTCYWNWDHFKKFVKEAGCAGAIPAYKGFHPHSLGSTNYAYLRESGGWVQDIQEKQPYTHNRMEEFASSGTYYFATAAIMHEAFRTAMEQHFHTGGEYYVSLAYKSLLAHHQPIAIYPLQHFMQWGTPEDLAEYNTWSRTFQFLADSCPVDPEPRGSLIIPMAGLGQRFASEGYSQTKPLIPVSGLPMVVQATHDLPLAEQYVFVLRADMPGYREVTHELKRLYPKSIIKTIDRVTEGQACTALMGLDALEDVVGHVPAPITIGACDNGALYSPDALKKLIDNPDVDVIVWGIRGYPNAMRHPNMFGWIQADGEIVRSISVKPTSHQTLSDSVVIGTFTFRHAKDIRRVIKRLIARGGRINGEFYMDSCINDAIELGLRCHLFAIDSYLCWGAPNDLRTFEYWQSCFHKWPHHPYRLELDRRIPQSQRQNLATRYQMTVPEVPAKRV